MPVGVVFNDIIDSNEGGDLCQQGFIFTKYSESLQKWWLVSAFLQSSGPCP